MSLDFTQQQQLMLLINSETRYQQDEIITRIREMMKNFGIPGAKFAKSPFRNVLNVATEPSASLETVKTYVRYQSARGDDKKIWDKRSNGSSFSDVLNQSLENLSDDALAIIKRVEEGLEERLKNTDVEDHLDRERIQLIQSYLDRKRIRLIQDLRLKLVQLYLGYLYREHVAVANQSDSQDNFRRSDNSDSATNKPFTKPVLNRP
jgi:hypothetical protein